MRSEAVDPADRDFNGRAEKERPLAGSRIDDRRSTQQLGTPKLSLI